ncbi:MAG: hypothetical protein IJ003_04575 [Candidatus Gastranaerophilales bacterium]|nr:hypothetical protein [Candidatus Gastranaerophilales bacterium]
MQNLKQKRENLEEIKIREYIYKYIKELQRHFDMSDKKMRLILYQVYKDLTPSFLKDFMKKICSMIKSFYRKNLKRN